MLKIVDWEKHYENFETKKIKHGMRWVPMPTKHDGLNFRKLMEADNGIAHFGAFVLMVEVAAKCEPRGTLQSADGIPLSPDDLRIKTGCPTKVFESALPVLAKIGWIEGLQDISGELPDSDRIPSGQHPSTCTTGTTSITSHNTPTGPSTDEPSEIFLKTWTDYWLKALKRANNPKKAAQKAWEARVKAGEATEEQLAAATANYALWWGGQRKEQQYVMQAKTFYGPKGRLDEFIKNAPPPEGPYVPPGLQDKAPPFSRSEASSVMQEIAQERAGLAEVVCGVCGEKYRTRKPEGEKICTPCFQEQKEKP